MILFDTRPFAYRKRTLHCDEVSLATLAEAYGTPLYVYSASHIRQRYELFAQAFSRTGRDHSHTICYAVKANSSLAILRLLGRMGAGFDIVSGGELARVAKAWKPALARTVFSGVGKQIAEIDAAIAAKILLFNVESAAELDLLAARAREAKTRVRFALRVNPDVFADTHPYISTGLREHKFGIDISLARAVYRKALKSQWLDAAGVSVHIGSQIRSPEPFAAAMSRVATLIEQLVNDGHDIRYVDAGGGLGIEYTDSEFDADAAVEGYASRLLAATAGISAHLLLEPGRFLVAQAGGLLTRVLYVKENGAKTFVITDAGMNDLIRPALYQAHHEIVPVKQARGGGRLAKFDVVGPVCESGDFFARDRELPAMTPGDLALLLDAGAYGMSLSSNYNTRGRPAEVLIDGEATKLIRRRETMRDLLAPELLPSL